jgi:predicted nucleotidyltransferase
MVYIVTDGNKMTPLCERKETIKTLCEEFGIAILYAFGSRSKEIIQFLSGESDLSYNDSDVDIGVKPHPGKRLPVEDKVRLALRLEETLGVKRVDLVLLPEADPFLSAEIIRGEKLFARDEIEADEYELYILRRAGDQIPLERERERLIFGEEE